METQTLTHNGTFKTQNMKGQRGNDPVICFNTATPDKIIITG